MDNYILAGLVSGSAACLITGTTLTPIAGIMFAMPLARSVMWCSRSVAKLEKKCEEGSWKETALRIGKWSLIIMALVAAVALTVAFGAFTAAIFMIPFHAALAGEINIAILSGLAAALVGFNCFASAMTVKDAAQTCFQFARTQRGDDKRPCIV